MAPPIFTKTKYICDFTLSLLGYFSRKKQPRLAPWAVLVD